jgi:hypothetical protein
MSLRIKERNRTCQVETGQESTNHQESIEIKSIQRTPEGVLLLKINFSFDVRSSLTTRQFIINTIYPSRK